jgi:hypothetical protein
MAVCLDMIFIQVNVKLSDFILSQLILNVLADRDNDIVMILAK